MKIIKKHFAVLAAPVLLAGTMLLNGCEKLPLQKNYKFEPKTLDPQQGMTAWDYLNKPRTDTLFNMMIRAIKYAGLEEEYKKPNRTFVILANQAITSRNVTTGVEATNTFFFRKPINGAAGKNLQSYSKAEIANLIKYHIIEGYHTYGTVGVDPKEYNTLRTDSAVNVVTINISNSNSYALQFNNFPGSIKSQGVRTSNLQMKDNCVIHVINTYMEYGKTP